MREKRSDTEGKKGRLFGVITTSSQLNLTYHFIHYIVISVNLVKLFQCKILIILIIILFISHFRISFYLKYFLLIYFNEINLTNIIKPKLNLFIHL